METLLNIIVVIGDWVSLHWTAICAAGATFCFGFLLAMDLYSKPEDRILFFTKE